MFPVAEQQLRSFLDTCASAHSDVLDSKAPTWVARAPGRLDILGGVADYSGSTVLEYPIHEAAIVAVQTSEDGFAHVRTLQNIGAGASDARIEVGALSATRVAELRRVGDRIRERCGTSWPGYLLGALAVLQAEGYLPARRIRGARMLLDSSVPVGAGVSSSAAIEVAAMAAVAQSLRVDLTGLELARLCQVVENHVVGAPCGIMDQVTCAMGRAGELVVLKCQPHDILGSQPVPRGWRFVGIDSAVKHHVGGSKYARARVGAFMGLKILQTLSRDDWGGYLANLSPVVWQGWLERIPEKLSGSEFLAAYGELPDTVTAVDPASTYNVRACTEHPILENNRVREMLALMQIADGEEDAALRVEAGRLLLESHSSYSDRLDLGAPETDEIVKLVLSEGPENGLYGGRITGGGSGGTVCVLCDLERSEAALPRVLAEYEKRTGLVPRLIAGTSPGALQFRVRHFSAIPDSTGQA